MIRNPSSTNKMGNRGVHMPLLSLFPDIFQTDPTLKKSFVDWSFPILYMRFFIIFYTPLYWTKRPAFILQGRNFPSGIWWHCSPGDCCLLWLEKIPGCMVLSVIAGLLIGFTDFGNFLSIPRILFFSRSFLPGKNLILLPSHVFGTGRGICVRWPSWEVLPSFYLLTSTITVWIRRFSMDDTLTQIWIWVPSKAYLSASAVIWSLFFWSTCLCWYFRPKRNPTLIWESVPWQSISFTVSSTAASNTVLLFWLRLRAIWNVCICWHSASSWCGFYQENLLYYLQIRSPIFSDARSYFNLR